MHEEPKKNITLRVELLLNERGVTNRYRFLYDKTTFHCCPFLDMFLPFYLPRVCVPLPFSARSSDEQELPTGLHSTSFFFNIIIIIPSCVVERLFIR
ncbi:hypothetical protein CEXT_65081 [Caerostris extrusa]|uniref:Uncharacterized protein n=1 Tax=Caerostris extrusa TaxID=172846 RepID=A0AAV4WGQ8_CAEEX|nr:hypothetical protein CEXT_65081 [Caerostris extrusa]